MEERAYTIPLRVVYNRAARKERAKRAMKHIREFIARHMHVEPENVKIHTSVNEVVWQRGIEKPPRKVKVVAVKDGETVWVYTPEARAEIEKAEKKAKRAVRKKAEEKKEERQVKQEEKEETKADKTEEKKEENAEAPVEEDKEEKSEQA